MLKIVFTSALDPFHRDPRSGQTWRDFTKQRGWTAEDHAEAERAAQFHAKLRANIGKPDRPNSWDKPRPWQHTNG
jgi:hypothetical protein